MRKLGDFWTSMTRYQQGRATESISVTELPPRVRAIIGATNVRCIEDTEIPQVLSLRQFDSEVGWSYLRNTNEEWKSVHASTKGKLTPSLGDALVETTTHSSVRPKEATPDWHAAFRTALDDFGRVRCQAEVEPYAQRYLQHHAFVAERRADSSNKGHREATLQELSLTPDPTRIGVVIVGDDEPREFRGHPLRLLKAITQISEDQGLHRQYLAAVDGEEICSASFVRALGVPCIVLADRLGKEYELFIERVVDYHERMT
ncbi:hypothetical protein SAMN04488133_2413 [Halobellus limi]|uniref:Uncharacterized protein n=1 Tax=Halobellus limi TaxID=699433 RepID=A0A1H6AMX6_9EURY|nr:hypothetical protein SAMN04488133_2413 [Halobellus limi]